MAWPGVSPHTELSHLFPYKIIEVIKSSLWLDIPGLIFWISATFTEGDSATSLLALLSCIKMLNCKNSAIFPSLYLFLLNTWKRCSFSLQKPQNYVQKSWKEERLEKAQNPVTEAAQPLGVTQFSLSKELEDRDIFFLGINQTPQTKISIRRSSVFSPVFDILLFLFVEKNHAQ